LAIQVVAQLAAKLGYKSRMEIVAARPSDETAMNKIRNVSSRISLKSIFLSSGHRTKVAPHR
jgi:hypothetical protein